MRSKSEKATISNKYQAAAKRAVERGFLVADRIENGIDVLHVFNKGVCVLITGMQNDGRSFSRYYDSKGVCIRTLTCSPAGAVEQIGRVY